MKYLIKICGITSKKDVEAVQRLGANFIGFVLVQKSKRFVDLKKLEALSIMVRRPLSSVALLADPSDDFLERLLMTCKVDYIQLHGNESPKRCEDIIKKFNIPIIKGVNVKNKLNLKQLTTDFEDTCDILLLDAPSEALPGGNGNKFDWDILRGFKSKKKWMLAGGLNIENIKSAIDITKAPAIDISSGLEISKGIKDSKLIEDFVIKCKNL